MAFSETDRELYELVLALRDESVSTASLSEADVDTTTLTRLLSAAKELKRRGLPEIYKRSRNRFEVKWAQPDGNAVTVHRETFQSFDEALTRAHSLQDAFQDIDGYP